MPAKQHSLFKSRLISLLFLFFNGVCIAAPVVKLTSEEYKEVASISLVHIPNAPETEEENRFSASVYVNQLNHFSFRKHNDQHVFNKSNSIVFSSTCDVDQNFYLSTSNFLPVPGYYAFLFRYNLF